MKKLWNSYKNILKIIIYICLNIIFFVTNFLFNYVFPQLFRWNPEPVLAGALTPELQQLTTLRSLETRVRISIEARCGAFFTYQVSHSFKHCRGVRLCRRSSLVNCRVNIATLNNCVMLSPRNVLLAISSGYGGHSSLSKTVEIVN